MRRWFFTAALAALCAAGCRGDKKESGATCTVVERSVREVDGALEVAASVKWTVKGKNYRLNKPMTVGRFDPREHSKPALEERYRPGAEIRCAVDPARPTRVDLQP
ncbi:MAG TPA: hypothetical protein VFU21_03145 [Kofleriaceae bacterium]|nr:hypothetical protein [Kofleriaceae bacterium]